MFRRAISAVFLVWALGFVWFAFALPEPADEVATDAVVVPTGGEGRIAQGLAVLNEGLAERMLVSGVDREVTPGEFAAEFEVDETQLDCCITLGFSAVDTRSNAAETAQWVEDNGVRTLRLVTTDWHMRRAAGELSRALPSGVNVVRDAVPSEPSFSNLFLEYHKLLASWAAGLIGL
ncbi:YdcF family protein [Erythrobacter rubeus]|uniref:YdcF family protein n=1 Tax=Erythrobacter rubeus TaxID=2760803 RepID=A0ABR8KTW3_9SPHN|nr:ElyC/SanA/YdcF family protein [Erythrobacter rubeus]MBD2842872.1 YdcF family protein [Erythrobacter rubeus]